MKQANKQAAFTVVELLVVIVVMGIIAAIILVSYTGIAKKATESGIISELDGAKRQFELYKAEHGVYPTSLDENKCLSNTMLTPNTDTDYCLKSGSGNIFTLSQSDGVTYVLQANKGSLTYRVSNDNSPALANCPVGFIVVPGSATYGTSNFCVMKYEAKVDDNGDGVGDINQTTGVNTWPANTYPISASRKLVSTPDGYPVAIVPQATAITAAQNYTKDCTGCHLISEAEWMTIAQNALGVDSNWSGGTVGSGYIYSGHNDGTPNTALVAAADDNDGYIGTGQVTGSNQRRTLKLSNGNVIWDMAGNNWEWTSGQVSSAIQPGIIGNTYSGWIQWTAVTTPGSLPVSVSPASTGISGSNLWNSAKGVGMLFSNPVDTTLRGFRRGGNCNSPGYAGILYLILNNSPVNSGNTVSFRVAAPAF